jgi:transcriptional regulator
MYTPSAFKVDDLPALHDMMRVHSFATLIASENEAFEVSHLPLLLEDRGAYGTLIGHMARANNQWKLFDGRRTALAIFHGPHAYISPSWYQTHPSVPTWNYVAIHASGSPRLVDNPAEALDILTKTVAKYESAFEKPWKMEIEEELLQKLMAQIVMFEMEITHLEGKFKLGQNRPAKDFPGVIDALQKSNDTSARETANLMAHYKKIEDLT